MADKPKPVCQKCGEAHWGFVKCEDVGLVEVRELEQAERRERNKVIPQPQHDPVRVSGLRTFRQVGHNRFVKERLDG